jgi:hypothetical protein
MIVEIEMISIGTTKITPKNRSELVCFGCVDRKRPVLGGPVRSPQYLGRSWTGCGPRLRVLGAKTGLNRTLKHYEGAVAYANRPLSASISSPSYSQSNGSAEILAGMRQKLFLLYSFNIFLSLEHFWTGSTRERADAS